MLYNVAWNIHYGSDEGCGWTTWCIRKVGSTVGAYSTNTTLTSGCDQRRGPNYSDGPPCLCTRLHVFLDIKQSQVFLLISSPFLALHPQQFLSHQYLRILSSLSAQPSLLVIQLPRLFFNSQNEGRLHRSYRHRRRGRPRRAPD